MGKEIERKFLCGNEGWRDFTKQQGAFGARILQGYLSLDPVRTVRVRLEMLNNEPVQGTITVKGLRIGNTRPEYEYLVDPLEAKEMLTGLCVQPLIDKTRYCILTEAKNFMWAPLPQENRQNWALDVYHGANEGLVINEVELQYEGEELLMPPWVDVNQEVTKNDEYYASNLVLKPFHAWTDTKLESALRMGKPIIPRS